MIERGEHLVPVEIKSSQTFNADYLAGLSKWSKYAGASALPAQLVCAGDTSMNRSGVKVHSLAHIKGLTPCYINT